MARKDKKVTKANKKKAKRAKRASSGPSIFANAISYVRKSLADCNYMILVMVIALSVFGVIMVFSAGFYSTVNVEKPDTYYYLRKQGMFAATGFVMLLVTANFDYHKYMRWSKPLLYISVGLLLILMTPLGVTVNNATRWINVGVTITPGEISKLCMIIWTSAFFIKHPKGARQWNKDGLLTVLGVMMVHAALIIWQPNLSTAIVVCAIMVAISIVAGMDMRYIGGVVGAGIAGVFAILTFGKGTHWYSRITSFLDPFAEAQGDGYQVTQGIIALGNGGLKGLGWGNSISKNLYLPEPQNDFILAIIGEELGFIGFLILMLAYIYLMYQCVMVALKARDRFGLFLSSGVAVMLGLHVIINVAVVTSSMPATGITLPFVSSGGTSIWVFMIAMGIVLNVSKGQKMSPLLEINALSEKERRKKRKANRENRENRTREAE